MCNFECTHTVCCCFGVSKINYGWPVKRFMKVPETKERNNEIHLYFICKIFLEFFFFFFDNSIFNMNRPSVTRKKFMTIVNITLSMCSLNKPMTLESIFNIFLALHRKNVDIIEIYICFFFLHALVDRVIIYWRKMDIDRDK